jgi:hypothetical protein
MTDNTSYDKDRDNTSYNNGRDNASFNKDRDSIVITMPNTARAVTMAGTARVMTMAGTARVITMTGTSRLAITVHNMNYNIIHVAASCTVHAISINQCVYRAILAAPSLNGSNDRPTNCPHHCCSLAPTYTLLSNCLLSNTELH